MPKPKKSALPPPRVRREPPTVEEAVAAAQDLSDELEHQITIAAGLIGLPEEEVRPHVLRAPRRAPELVIESRPDRTLRSTAPLRGPRTVIVERRPAVGGFSRTFGGRR